MERLDHLLNMVDPANRPDAEALIRRIQADHAAELEAATRSQSDARLAALNMMEDAVLAKNRLEITQFALDHSADAVFWVERDFTFSYVNNSACQLLGYTREELLKLSVPDIDPKFQTKRMEETFATLEQSGTLDMESTLIAKDGRIIPVEVHDSIIRIGSRTFICAFIHDIINRKQAEQALRESRKKLQITLNSIGDAVISTDTAGRVILMNPVAEALTGWSQAEAVGKPLEDIFRVIHEENRQPLENPVIGVLASGRVIGMANHALLLAKDGREIPIADSGAPITNEAGETIGVVLVFRDQTKERADRNALEHSEAQYRLLFDNMTTGFALHEMIYDEQGKPFDYRYIQVNPAFEQLTGLTAARAVGHTVRELLPEIEPVWIEKFGNVAKTGVSIEFEDYSQDIQKHFDVRAFSPAPNQFAVIFSDITERIRMQEAIEKRMLALTRPMEDTPAIAFDELFDLKEIQRIQDEFAAATGVASIVTQIDGTPITHPSNFTCLCMDIIRKTEKGCSNCFKSDAAIGRNNPDGPVVQPCLSGGLWDAGVSITVGGKHIANWLIGQVRDETQTDEHMRAYAKEIGAAEQPFMDAFYNVPVMSLAHFKEIAQALFTLANQLSASAYQNVLQARFIAEEKKNKDELVRLSTAIEQSPEAVIITDTSGSIQYINPAFERITGYSAEEAIGKNSRILKSGEHDAAFYSSLWETIRAGSVWHGHLINKRKNGELYTEEASIAPVRDSSERITGYVAVKRDITEELSREEMFRQSQKMEAVGQLAGGIAHDFNNILQAILGFSELLLGKLSRETTEYRNTNEIHKAALRAADLTRQLLTFSRKQPVQRTEVDLNAAVRNMEVLLDVLLGEKIQLQLDLCENLLKTRADYSQITQIIMNLAVNSRDAMPDGGRLSISTENVILEQQDADALPDVAPGDFVCLSVTDTGCGMNQETKERLFEPFFTTKEVGKGTGLGLSVLYGIVKQSKGWVHVYSEEGHGTSFKIYLPAAKPAAKNTIAAAKTTCCESILLAEDDAELRAMVVRILETAGYKPVVAATAEEALKLFTSKSGAFDLLFSDIVLPGKSGIELADELRAKNPALPVLLYSGYRDQRERWKDLNSKGYHFTQKPFTVAGLLAAVNGAITEPV